MNISTQAVGFQATQKTLITSAPLVAGEEVEEVSSSKSHDVGCGAELVKQDEYLQRLVLSVSVQEHQEKMLARLEEKINKKKEEFRTLALGEDGSVEERTDLERALLRIDWLLEIPKKSEILKKFPQAFNKYVTNLLENILENDARKLNFVLACSPLQEETAEEFDKVIMYIGDIAGTDDDKYIAKIEKCLPEWNSGNNCFYLPGFPIVLSIGGLPGLYKGKSGVVEKNNLPDDELEKLVQATELIKESSWGGVSPDSLKMTECIFLVSEAPFAGKAGRKNHPIVVLISNTDTVDFAGSIIHEDYHHVVNSWTNNSQISIFDSDNAGGAPAVEHLWVGNKSRSSLLDECFTYGKETRFYLCLFEQKDITVEQKAGLIKKIASNIKQSKTALEILNKDSGIMHEAALGYIFEANKIWNSICDSFDSVINSSLSSSESSIRQAAYSACASRVNDNNDEPKSNLYRICFERKVAQEDSAIVLNNLILYASLPDLKMLGLAQKCFMKDDIQQRWLGITDGFLSKADTRVFGYMTIVEGYQACIGEQKDFYSKKFTDTLQQEENAEILKEVSTHTFIPLELQKLASQRLQELSCALQNA